MIFLLLRIEIPKRYTLRELYFNGKSMPLSRWPNKGFTEFTDIISDTSEIMEKIGIVYEDPHISAWEHEPNILLHGYWKYLWADAYEHVSQIDTASKVIWLSPLTTNITSKKIILLQLTT